MSTSSVPVNYYQTSSDDVGIIAQDICSLDNITISNGGSSYYISNPGALTGTIGSGLTYSTGSVTIASGASISIADIKVSDFTWKMPEEFVDSFPDYDRVQKMCEEYPGLKIAYEKFVTTYKLVKDHYDTPEDQRPIP